MKFIILISLLFLVGCDSSHRAIVTASDLTPISASVGLARTQIKGKEYEKAISSLDEAQKIIQQKQSEVIQASKAANDMANRLNYIEPKYAEAVGIIWKWRLIAIGSWALFVGWFVLRQYLPILKLLILITCLSFMTGCSDNLPNDCVLDAINFNQAIASKQRLDKSDVWNDILIVQIYKDGQTMGHCYSVFLWKGQLWAWDQDGSRLLRTTADKPLLIARELNENAIAGYWIKDHRP